MPVLVNKISKYESIGRFLYLKDALNPQHEARLREIERLWSGPPVDAIVTELKALGISLRQVDWLVSKYGVSNPIVQWRGDVAVSLGEVYYAMLKVWRRRAFDCFARHAKVLYQAEDGSMKQTSIGQLNFWLIMNRDFALMDILRRPGLMHKVREDMQVWEGRQKTKKRKRSRRKAPPVSPTVKIRTLVPITPDAWDDGSQFGPELYTYKF